MTYIGSENCKLFVLLQFLLGLMCTPTEKKGDLFEFTCTMHMHIYEIQTVFLCSRQHVS
jgi:hypothetical protein